MACADEFSSFGLDKWRALRTPALLQLGYWAATAARLARRSAERSPLLSCLFGAESTRGLY